MTVKFKKLNVDAVVPTYAHNGDAGLDLTALSWSQEFDKSGKLILVYHTGLAVQIPQGYVGLLFMRSSVSERSLMLCNAVGVIDSSYTGEILIKFKVTTDAVPTLYKPNEKVAQLVIVPFLHAELEEATELTQTDRGDKGFGSTDTATDEEVTTETATDETTTDEVEEVTVVEDETV